MDNNKMYLTVSDVQGYLGISKSKAYGVIRQMNDELKNGGYLTVAGKVSKAYFEKKVYAYGC